LNYKKGDRVRNPNVPAWGPGLVLEDSDDRTVRVFFVEPGEKTLMLSHVRPVKVSGIEAESLVLDNLKIDGGRVNVRYKSLAASMEFFLQEFPGGFRGERFRFHERNYKEEVALETQKRLGLVVMKALLDEGNYRGICDHALKLTGIRSNAMIFKNEKMALRDGVKSEEGARMFARSLFDVLHGTSDFDGRFNDFVNCLQTIGADKWTNATYFLFFMHPDRHMFVKPTITQNAAEVCGYEINYRPELNAKTYRSVMEFSAHLEKAIASLEPRDMIDVQSFMWCIAPGTYTAADV
jgi:hypothetical protein